MKITALEEYGLRCLMQLAQAQAEGNAGLSISEISKKDGLSIQYVSKITTHLRRQGIIGSVRGVHGGYRLAKKPQELKLSEIARALGDPMFDEEFCVDHAGKENACVHEKNCSVRSVWNVIHRHVNMIMNQITLQDLLQNEAETKEQLLKVVSG